jgi:hypothetical protein
MKAVMEIATVVSVSASSYITQMLEDLIYLAEAAAYIEAAILEGHRDGLLMALGQVGALNRDIQARWRS